MTDHNNLTSNGASFGMPLLMKGGAMSDFARAALIRAIRTMAQTAVAMLPAGAMIQQVDILAILSTSALAGVISLLTSVATGLPEVDDA